MSVLDRAQGDGVVEDGVARVVVEGPASLGEDHVLRKGRKPSIDDVRIEGRADPKQN